MNERPLSVPSVAIKFTFVVLGIHILRSVLSPEVDRDLVYYFGFNFFRNGNFNFLWIYTSITSIFLHANWWHLCSNILWLMVLSAQTNPPIGERRFVLFFILCGVAGALVHFAFNWDNQAILIGASGAIFGLLGAGAHDLRNASTEPKKNKTKQLLHYAFLVMVVNLGVALASKESVSWEAHAGGFFFGLIFYPKFLSFNCRPKTC